MDRRFRRVGIALLVACVVTGAVLLAVFLVSSRWPADAIRVPRDAATIQEAIARAIPGSTIVLQDVPGGFRGPVTIDKADVALVSLRRTVRLESSGDEPALTIRADGVAIEGLEIVAESVGIRIESARCSVGRTVVLDARVGIQLFDAQECSLRDVETKGGEVGVELDSARGNTLIDVAIGTASAIGLQAIGSWSNTLQRCRISDAPIGVALEQGSSQNELRDCRVDGASIAGVEISGSNGNVVVGGTIRDARVGVVLEGATGNEILDCEIEEVDLAGLLFQQAIQNRAMQNAIASSSDAGILLSQSAENAISYNRIEACSGAGIRLVRSDRNLVVGNRLLDNAVGLEGDRSSHGRVLRNAVTSAIPSSTGIALSAGTGNRLLDNVVHGGLLGIVVAGSDGNVLLRNRIEAQAAVGLALVNGSANSVGGSELADNEVGIAAVDSIRAEILSNRVAGNGTGVLLARSGTGVRIEGNVIRSNRIGIRQTDALGIEGLEPWLDGQGEVVSPLVASNTFADNEVLDVSNETPLPVYVGGNWWGGVAGERDLAEARVSDGVLLEGSAWKGTVALGTEAGVSQVLLGRILQVALTEIGFRVIDLVGMGDRDRVRDALRMQDVDFIWWGTSPTAFSTEADGGEAIATVPIPATRHWAVVVSEATARQLTEPTVSAFADWIRQTERTVRYAGTRSVGSEVAASWEETYGLRESIGSVSWVESIGEAESLLKFSAVEMAIVDNLEETLTSSGFVALEDDLHAFEPAEILVVSRPALFERFPEVEALVSDLAGSMTTSVVHDLISRVRLLQREPDAVAREYLTARGLRAE